MYRIMYIYNWASPSPPRLVGIFCRRLLYMFCFFGNVLDLRTWHHRVTYSQQVYSHEMGSGQSPRVLRACSPISLSH